MTLFASEAPLTLTPSASARSSPHFVGVVVGVGVVVKAPSTLHTPGYAVFGDSRRIPAP